MKKTLLISMCFLVIALLAGGVQAFHTTTSAFGLVPSVLPAGATGTYSGYGAKVVNPNNFTSAAPFGTVDAFGAGPQSFNVDTDTNPSVQSFSCTVMEPGVGIPVTAAMCTNTASFI